MRFECGVEKQFKCTRCPYTGRQKAHLISHMMRIHDLLPENVTPLKLHRLL